MRRERTAGYERKGICVFRNGARSESTDRDRSDKASISCLPC